MRLGCWGNSVKFRAPLIALSNLPESRLREGLLWGESGLWRGSGNRWFGGYCQAIGSGRAVGGFWRQSPDYPGLDRLDVSSGDADRIDLRRLLKAHQGEVENLFQRNSRNEALLLHDAD